MLLNHNTISLSSVLLQLTVVYTPKRDDEHPRLFHMGVDPPPPRAYAVRLTTSMCNLLGFGSKGPGDRYYIIQYTVFLALSSRHPATGHSQLPKTVMLRSSFAIRVFFFSLKYSCSFMDDYFRFGGFLS